VTPGGAAQGVAAAFVPLPPDDEVVLLLVDEVDGVLVEGVDEEPAVSAFLVVESPAPVADFSALTLPERESLR
jgi:hypothetical protein